MRSCMTLCLLGVLAAVVSSQSIAFTGDVQADFPPDRFFIDPGGVDVGMPAALVAAGQTQSGFDLAGVGLAYDGVNDVLHVGIDSFGVFGDADGDGDPSAGSALFAADGGSDYPDFGGTEGVTLALDLDDDGNFDVIFGTAMLTDLFGMTCAVYDGASGPISEPWARFGAALPLCDPVLSQTPSAAWPDLEFSIPNFSLLTAMFGDPTATSFGLHVFAGSFEDGGVGEDVIPFVTVSLGQGPDDCVPIPNFFELVSTDPAGPDFLAKTRFGLLNLYGACAFVSPVQSPIEIPIPELPGTPSLMVGVFGAPSSVFVIDFGIPLFPRPPVSCFDFDFLVPGSVPPGTAIYAQVLAYPLIDVTETYYTSNVVTYVQP